MDDQYLEEHTPPSDLDAEKDLLGVLLIKPSLCADVDAILKPDDFYLEANRVVYGAIQDLWDANRAVDPTLLRQRLLETKALEDNGGSEHLTEVLLTTRNAPLVSYWKRYAGIVREKARRRGIIDTCWAAVKEAYDDAIEASDVLDKAETQLSAIGASDLSDEPTTAAEATIAAMDRIDVIMERGGRAGVLTGILTIDEELGGLFPGEFNILAARPSMGKTSLALQIADHVSRHGKFVYFVSLEMASDTLMTRLLCMHARVSSQVLRAGKDGEVLTTEQMAALVDAAHPYSKAGLVIHDKPETTIRSIRRWARRFHSKHPLSLVVIDYLQLIEAEDSRISRHEQVGRQSRALKALAIELNIPVLCLCQINRESTKTGSSFPRLSQLRESGSLEQDCDVGMVLREPTKEECDEGNIPEVDGSFTDDDPRVRVLDVQKNRNGAQMPLLLDWTPSRTRFCKRFSEDYRDPTADKQWDPTA